MKTFALIGKSGTGKSYRCMDIVRDNKIEAVIDDGLLISKSRIIAGSSAKHEDNKITSVKRAIFAFDDHAERVKAAIAENNIQSVLILGTSERMVSQIAERLELPEFEQLFRIEDISTPEEIALALEMRNRHGKHIIPAPMPEVKKLFSGYFLSALLPQGKRDRRLEKTIMRPAYSYLGDFKISPRVISDICRFEVLKTEGVTAVHRIKSNFDEYGFADISVELSLILPCNIPKTAKTVQTAISNSIEYSTSIIVKNVDIFVRTVTSI